MKTITQIQKTQRNGKLAEARGVSHIRETMNRLPGLLQPVLTELTGKAGIHEKPLFRWSAGGRLAQSLGILTAGISASLAALSVGGVALVLLPIGWVLTVSALRAFQTSFVHHAAHGTFLKGKLGIVVAEVLSTVALIQPLSGYKPDHDTHHRDLATHLDADLQFLAKLGFRPGRPVEEYLRQFRRMIVSPRFHALYAWVRLTANLTARHPLRRLAAVLWIGVFIGSAWWSGAWGALLVAWLIPLVPLYQVAGLGQLLTEHNWVNDGKKGRPTIARLTSARFFGEAAPEPGLVGAAKTRAWLRWTLRMLFVHLPQRLFFVQGDLPNHDLHHRNVKGGDWPNAAYARRDDIVNGSPGWPSYTEVWGIGAALESTFTHLAALPEDAVLGRPETYGSKWDELLGM